MPESSVSLQSPVPNSTRGTRPSSSLEQSLKQYAIAALGTAGMSSLAVAQAPAHHMLYTAANLSLTAPTGGVVSIDLNHDGIPDITFSAYGFSQAFSGHGGSAFGSLFVIPGVNNLAIGGRAIPFGVPIDLLGGFNSSKQRMAYAHIVELATSSYHRTSSGGPFKNVTNKFVGVKIQVAGKMHEGWVRISVTCHRGSVSATITGYAYDQVANERVFAGRILVPEKKASTQETVPASLGMLAAGSSTIPYWRKQQE